MSNISSLSMDRCIKEYAEYLSQGGEPLTWSEIFDGSFYTPIEVLEFLIESHVLFSQKPPMSKSPEQLEAFDQIVNSCLQDILIQLREGRSIAKEYWQSLQSYIEKAVQKSTSDPVLLSRLILQISDLGFRFDTRVLELARVWMENLFESEPDTEALSASMALDGFEGDLLTEEEISDEFGFFEAFSNQIAYLKLNTLSELFIQILHTDVQALRETVCLFLLHHQPCVRQQVLSVLSLIPSRISPLSLYRMIRIRNWIPESEKQQLDIIISSAKKLSVAPKNSLADEQAQSAVAVMHLASTIDGAGSQNLMSLFKVGTSFQIYAGVVKEKVGWIDLWSTPHLTRKECEATFRKIKESLFTIEVNKDYIASSIPLALGWNKESGVLSAPLVISWAERLALADFNPQPEPTSQLLAMLEDQSQRVHDERFQVNSLNKSRGWLTSKGFAAGWFENNESTENHLDDLLIFLEQFSERSLDDHEVVDHVVRTLIGPEREKWSNRFVRLAYWAHSNVKKRGPSWEDFLVLAIVLRDKTPIEKVPIMREMGVCTLSYYLPSSVPSE